MRHLRRVVGAWCLFAVALSQGEECHVVFACDGAHMAGLEAAINSVRLSANAFRVNFTVVVPLAEKHRVPAGARVVTLESTKLGSLRIPGYKDFGSEQKVLSFGNLSSRLNYARFFLGDIVKDARYALYLDVDVIVRCDASWLLRIDAPALFEEYPDAVIAVVDRDRISTGGRRRQLYYRGWSFNAGVFVADLERWRAIDATGQLERSMRAVSDALLLRSKNDTPAAAALPWSRPSSQLPMIRVFDASKVAPLPSEWNRLLRHAQPRDVEVMLSNGSTPRYDCIWHFTGPLKPWDYARKNVSHWTREMWEPYAQNSVGSLAWPYALPRTREEWRQIFKRKEIGRDAERISLERQIGESVADLENAADEVRREREAIEAEMRSDEAAFREREKQLAAAAAAKEREKAEKLLKKNKKIADAGVKTTKATTTTTNDGEQETSGRFGGGGEVSRFRQKKMIARQRTAEEALLLEQRKKERRAKRAALRAAEATT